MYINLINSTDEKRKVILFGPYSDFVKDENKRYCDKIENNISKNYYQYEEFNNLNEFGVSLCFDGDFSNEKYLAFRDQCALSSKRINGFLISSNTKTSLFNFLFGMYEEDSVKVHIRPIVEKRDGPQVDRFTVDENSFMAFILQHRERLNIQFEELI